MNLCSPTESEEHGFCFLKLSVHCVGRGLELDNNCIGLPAGSFHFLCQLLVLNLCSPRESEKHGFVF